MSMEELAFLVMVFIAVFLLASSVIVPAFSTEAKVARRLRSRLKEVAQTLDANQSTLVRKEYQQELGPLARWLESLPGMAALRSAIEQAGRTIPAYRLILMAAAAGAGIGVLVLMVSRQPLLGLLAAAVAFAAPLFKIRLERDKRLARVEEQLPDALNTMTRALRAGHPFVEAVQFVADEMSDPIAKEFRTTFADINYGMSVKAAFFGLLQRVPSMTLMTVVTAVLIQRDTGGNLAEILDRIGAVVRSRFRFQRRLRTLSAEGRMSAWILTLIPFGLAAMLSFTNPDYLPMLVKDPTGRTLIMVAFFNIIVGIFWIRRIIRFQV